MSCELSRSKLERFRAAIIEQIGLQFDDAKFAFLGEVLKRRLDKLGHSSDAYLFDLERQSSRNELKALARELTVGETHFFRNIEQFHALAEVVLPERVRVERTPRVLRLLSAGCASGEEAYSIAIVARESIADSSWNILIRAVDLNSIALEKAAQARYSQWALRETPPDVQRRWFQAAGREVVLDESVRSSVKFEARNLASEDAELWLPSAYDAIFCRNVLMYFAPEQMRAAIERIAQSLAPGGFLFLGHAETLRGVSDRFHLCHTHGTFYYRRKENDGPVELRAVQAAQALRSAAAPTFDADSSWVESIRNASERVAALVPEQAPAISTAREASLPWDPAPALDLLRRERFAEALDVVRAGPRAADEDSDVLLLEATLLAHSGDISAAEVVCRRLLLIEEFNAGAHYVLALCRERSGQPDAAREQYRIAAYLDPEFAMPRLHLGLLARGCGDHDVARRELAQALALLGREDASRLVLFGGGFNREALMSLCGSAFRKCGGRP